MPNPAKFTIPDTPMLSRKDFTSDRQFKRYQSQQISKYKVRKEIQRILEISEVTVNNLINNYQIKPKYHGYKRGGWPKHGTLYFYDLEEVRAALEVEKEHEHNINQAAQKARLEAFSARLSQVGGVK